MKFYRYIATEHAILDRDGDYQRPSYPNPTLELLEYDLHKETPKGYWIGYGRLSYGKLRSHGKWISKTSRRRFAYPTKQQALDNYIARTERRIRILSWAAESCIMSIAMAKITQNRLQNGNI